MGRISAERFSNFFHYWLRTEPSRLRKCLRGVNSPEIISNRELQPALQRGSAEGWEDTDREIGRERELGNVRAFWVEFYSNTINVDIQLSTLWVPIRLSNETRHGSHFFLQEPRLRILRHEPIYFDRSRCLFFLHAASRRLTSAFSSFHHQQDDRAGVGKF